MENDEKGKKEDVNPLQPEPAVLTGGPLLSEPFRELFLRLDKANKRTGESTSRFGRYTCSLQ